MFTAADMLTLVTRDFLPCLGPELEARKRLRSRGRFRHFVQRSPGWIRSALHRCGRLRITSRLRTLSGCAASFAPGADACRGKYRDHLVHLYRLGFQRLRGCRSFLDQRRILLGDIIHLSDGLVHLFDATTLFFRG